MKCPNCGQEVMNVNGKFICLDCGIQVGGMGTTPTTPSGPSIVNHTANLASLASDESTEAVPSPDPTPTDLPTIPEPVEKPVQNIYEQALKEESDPVSGSFDFPVAESATPDSGTGSVQSTEPKTVVPDFPISLPADNHSAPEIIAETTEEEVPSFDSANEAPTKLVPDFPTFEAPESASAGQAQTLEVAGSTEEAAPEITLPNVSEAGAEALVELNAGEVPSPAAALPDFILNNQEPAAEAVSGLESFSPEQEKQPNLNIPNFVDPQTSNDLVNSVEENPMKTGVEQGVSTAGIFPDVQSAETLNPKPVSVQEAVADSAAAVAVNQTTSTTETAPNSFFQPETMAISPASQAEIAQNLTFDAPSVPAGTPEQPEVGMADDQSATVSAKETEVKEDVQEPAPKNLDELLNINPVPEVATSPDFANFNPPSFDSLKSVDPLAISKNDVKAEGEIPSVESVFGKNPGAQTTTAPVVAQGKSKKVLFIVIGALVGLLVVVGAVFGFIAYQKKAAQKKQLLLEQELLKISDKVANAMDTSMDVTVNFEETIDFTKVTFVESDDENKAEQFKKLSQKPVENKGFWENDDRGSASIESNLEKKVYKADKNKTLVYSDRWVEIEGYDIASAPVLYNPQSKGGPFYVTQVEKFVNLGGESVDGETLTKVKIIPKKDMMQSVIRGANPVLASAKFESINMSNIEIIAWIDSESLIRKITFIGDLGVTSDLFEGTVSINSKAEYKYDQVTIETPTAFGKEINLPKAETVTEEVLPRKFEIVDMRG